jgi:hypothetical protein
VEGGAEQSSLMLCVRFWDGRGRVQSRGMLLLSLRASWPCRLPSWGGGEAVRSWRAGMWVCMCDGVEIREGAEGEGGAPAWCVCVLPGPDVLPLHRKAHVRG